MSDIHTILLLAVPLAGVLLALGIAIDAFPLKLPPVTQERTDDQNPQSH